MHAERLICALTESFITDRDDLTEAQMRRRNIKAQVAIGIVCAILSFAVATQFISVRKNVATETKQAKRAEELQLELGKEKEKNADLYLQLYSAQNDLKQYREEAENSSDYTKVLSDQLKRSEVLAGLTEVEGQGIILKLSDSSHPSVSGATTSENEMLIIHDSDLRLAITELAAAGAEAYAINGQRIISTTPIRCVGPVITVNEQKMAPPFEISAIGDPKTLEAAVNMRGGLADLYSSVGIGVEVITSDKIQIPRYTGTVNFQYAAPVIKESGEE